MSTRRAPADGYDFGAKRHYRRAVWATFRRNWRGQMADKVFALMPSSEGAEIEVALDNGVREENLILIDQNPAIVATLKRKYPKVTTYGVTAARAAVRIALDFGQINGVNLDLCGGADRPLFETIEAWTAAQCLSDRASVAITVLRGRERRGTFGDPTRVEQTYFHGTRTRLPVGRDALRVDWIGRALGSVGRRRLRALDYKALCTRPYSAFGTRYDTYRSVAGTQTFLWVTFQLHRMPCFCDWCICSFERMLGLSLYDAMCVARREWCATWGVAAVEAAIARDTPHHWTPAHTRAVLNARNIHSRAFVVK